MVPFLVIFISSVLGAKDSWTPAGPDGGFILSFAIAPGSPNVIYAGGDVYGGIYKSINSGASWEFMGNLSNLGAVLDIKIHPDSFDIVYAACGKEGIYKTTNGGLNWIPIFKREDVVYSIGINPGSPNTVYAGLIIDSAGEFGLYKSTDGGTNWSDSSFQSNSVLCMDFVPESLNVLYTGTSGGVFRNVNNGGWTFCGSPSATIHSIEVIDFNNIYIGTLKDTRDSGAVYKTTNGGTSWDTCYVLGKTIWGLAVDPDSSNIIYIAAGSNMSGLEGIFKSTDSGETWLQSNNGLTDRMARGIKIDPVSSNIVYATTDGLGGVYKSTDRGNNWIQNVSGMKHTPVQAMCFDSANVLYAAVGWGTYKDIPCIFKTTNGGDSWDTLSVIPSPYYMTSIWDIVIYPNSSGIIYAAGMSHCENTVTEPSKGLLYRSVDNGVNWEELWAPDSIWILCLAIDSVSGNIYAGTGGSDTSRIYKIYRSTDTGKTWQSTSGWPSKCNSIFDIVIDPASPNILYAGTGGAVFKSTDYGANWVPKAIIPCAYSLLIDPDSTNIIYSASGGAYIDSGGVYKSINSGDSWDKIGGINYPVTSIVGNFGTSNILYAGTGGSFLQSGGKGVFRSINNGAAWDSINSGLEQPFILSMVRNKTANIIYAGTAAGIFRYNEIGVEENSGNEIRNDNIRFSVSPSPCNSYIEIHYFIPTASRVIIKIYDITGRTVHTFAEGTKKSGNYTIKLNTKDLPSGVYFMEFNTRNYNKKSKIVLIK